MSPSIKGRDVASKTTEPPFVNGMGEIEKEKERGEGKEKKER